MMKQTSQHDIELIREILVEQPFTQAKGSRMIGMIWKKVMDNVNVKSSPHFILKDTRGVRERYGILEKKYKKKIREEINASGIAVKVPDEFDKAMEEKIVLFESNEERREKEKESKSDEKKPGRRCQQT